MPSEIAPDDMVKIGPQFRLQWEEAQQMYVLLYPEGMVQLSDTAADVVIKIFSIFAIMSVPDVMGIARPILRKRYQACAVPSGLVHWQTSSIPMPSDRTPSITNSCGSGFAARSANGSASPPIG